MKAEEEEERGSRGVEKLKRRRRQRESWHADLGMLSLCTETCSGFCPQDIQFPPPSFPQGLLVLTGFYERKWDVNGITFHHYPLLNLWQLLAQSVMIINSQMTHHQRVFKCSLGDAKVSKVSNSYGSPADRLPTQLIRWWWVKYMILANALEKTESFRNQYN